MNSNYIIKYKWFWAWNDDKEEAWLSEMSRQGLHLKRVSIATYYFEQGNPENYTYQLDYRSLKSKEKDSYLQLFKDAGWEHVGDMNGWVYFRIKTDPGETPEIYSDAESKTGKYQRVMYYLIILLPILLLLRPSPPDEYGIFSVVIEAFFAMVLLLFTVAIVQLMRRMKKVKEQK